METRGIGQRLCELCGNGNYVQAIDELYAEDAEGAEPMAAEPIRGKDKLRAGTEQFLSENEMTDTQIEGPMPFGDRFIVRFAGTNTMRDGSGSQYFVEYGLYTVKDGKIVKQEFFYDLPEA